MSERRAVTKKLALEYERGSKARKGQILDQVCELNRWAPQSCMEGAEASLGVPGSQRAVGEAAALWGVGDNGVAVSLRGPGHPVWASCPRVVETTTLLP
jgi:hypothetical protein